MSAAGCPLCGSPAPRCHRCGLQAGAEGIWHGDGAPVAINYSPEASRDCAELEVGSFWFAHRNRVLLATLRRWPPGGPVIDLGGGNGFVARALEAAGHGAVLVEPSLDGCRTARARGLERVVHAALEQLATPAATLHAIALLDVLEHVSEPLPFLARLRELLVPGGRLYLTVPAHQLLWSEADVQAGHQRRYTLSTLERELGAAGLTREYASYYFAPLALPLLVGRRLLRARCNAGPAHAPRPLVRQLIELPLRLEEQALAHVRLPFGASIVAVHARPA